MCVLKAADIILENEEIIKQIIPGVTESGVDLVVVVVGVGTRVVLVVVVVVGDSVISVVVIVVVLVVDVVVVVWDGQILEFVEEFREIFLKQSFFATVKFYVIFMNE